jgi:TRAP-type transport system small permease protein
MDAFDQAIDKFFRGLELLLSIAFVGIVVLNFANVLGRYGFSRALIWADEIQVFAMIALTFLGAAIVTWRRQHLRMDVVSAAFPRPVRVVLKLVESLLLLAVCTFAAWHALDYTKQMFLLGRASDTAGVPMWIVHSSVALGWILIVATSLLHLRRTVKCELGAQPTPASTPLAAGDHHR